VVFGDEEGVFFAELLNEIIKRSANDISNDAPNQKKFVLREWDWIKVGNVTQNAGDQSQEYLEVYELVVL